MRHMTRKICVLIVFSLPAFLSARPAWAQTYEPGPAPTIGPIQHVAVEDYPTPTSRTDLGLGETMTCKIDPDSWVDIDWEVNYGTTDVYDGMGIVTWSCDTPGGKVYPLEGNTTTFTADDDLDVDTAVTITVSVADAGNFAADGDPAVQVLQVVVKTPQGVAVTLANDKNAGWTAGKDNLGAYTVFQFQVLPSSVNFKTIGTKVRASWVKSVISWNDATTTDIDAATSALPLTNLAGIVNLTSFGGKSGLYPVEKIANTDFSFTLGLNIERDTTGGGTWTAFTAATQRWDYKGKDSTASVTMTGSDNSSKSSEKWQGPWK